MSENKNWEHRAKTAIKKEALKEFAGWTDRDFINCIIDLREQIKSLEINQGQELQRVNEHEVKEDQFNKSWSVPTKIVFILHLLNKVLLSSEIYAKLISLDRSFKDYSSSKVVLSNYLTRSAKSGRIKKIKLPGIKTHYFALPDWMDENGLLLANYKKSIAKY
ncbi:MAG: hypothetical protein H0W61_13170 [Bacteroidetes bacterium]|nr:hypothetical protein [Bacteroidota bacterium]